MKMNVRSKYSQSDEYDFQTRLERINLDEERRHDVINGNGFIVSSPKAIKDDIKDPNGIFSTKYGPGLQDINAFGNRYRCKCGHTTSKFYHGLRCEVCGEKVEFKDDNFSMFGYICLKDPYHIIHPNLYMSLAFFIGEKDFLNIITPIDKKDENGNEIEIKKPKGEPYYGIGLIDFYEMASQESVRLLRRAVDTCLTEQERLVIRLRYGLDTEEPLRQREVADRTGISRSYVSRIEKRALKKLRAALE